MDEQKERRQSHIDFAASLKEAITPLSDDLKKQLERHERRVDEKLGAHTVQSQESMAAHAKTIQEFGKTIQKLATAVEVNGAIAARVEETVKPLPAQVAGLEAKVAEQGQEDARIRNDLNMLRGTPANNANTAPSVPFMQSDNFKYLIGGFIFIFAVIAVAFGVSLSEVKDIAP